MTLPHSGKEGSIKGAQRRIETKPRKKNDERPSLLADVPVLLLSDRQDPGAGGRNLRSALFVFFCSSQSKQNSRSPAIASSGKYAMRAGGRSSEESRQRTRDDRRRVAAVSSLVDTKTLPYHWYLPGKVKKHEGIPVSRGS